MEHMSIEARPRNAGVTKSELKRLRRMGHIPAAVFGRGMEPVLVTVDARALNRVLGSEAGVNTLIDLTLEGRRHLVRLTEVDLDPIARTFLHVGLHTIQRNEASKATVRIEIVGEPEDVHTGLALLEPGALSVEVKSLPEDLVPALTLDISDMKIGDVRHVSDLPIPERLELLSAPDTAIVSVRAKPAMVEEATEAADEASADASPAEDGAAAAG